MKAVQQESALACEADAIPVEQRAAHAALISRLFGRAHEKQELSDGYAYRFDAAELANIARFIENERRCCPFLTFALLVAPGADVVWLRMTGPAGTQAFLDDELMHTQPALAALFPVRQG
jgi:hypothetical protein